MVKGDKPKVNIAVNVTGVKKQKDLPKEGGDGQTPRAGANKVKVAIEKAVEKKITTGGGVITKKAKEDDSDDPIAQAIKLREKFGGNTSVVPQAEAKKLGLIKTTKTEGTNDIAKKVGTNVVSKIEDKKKPVKVEKENKDSEN